MRQKKPQRATFALGALVLGFAPLSVHAQTESWTGTAADGNWSNALNWNPSTAYPNAPDAAAVFGNVSNGQASVNLTENITVGSLSIDSSNSYMLGAASAPYSISFQSSSGAASLEVDDTFGDVPQTVNAPLILTGELQITMNDNAPAGLTLDGGLSGGGALDVSGPGVVVLAAADNATGGVNIAAGTTLRVPSNPFKPGSLTIAAGGTLDLDGANGFVSSIAGGGTVTQGGVAVVGFTVDNSADCTFAGQITGPINFTKSNTGTLLLSGQSAYSGTTSITNGTLKSGANNCLPVGTSPSISTGAMLDLNGFNQTVASLLGSGTVTNSNTATPSTFTISNAAAGMNSTSFLGNLNLTVGSTGVVSLTANNNYTGVTTVTAGTLKAVNANAIPATTVLTLGPNTVFDCSGNNITLTGIGGDATSKITNSGGLVPTVTFNIPATVTSTYPGSITGNVSVTKSGLGTLVLSGNNDYEQQELAQGTVVSAGTLTINTPAPKPGSGTFDVEVKAGATLNGTGNITGGVSVDKGATLSGGLTIGGIVKVDEGTISPGGPNVAGTLTLAGGFLFDADLTANAGTYSWDLVNNTTKSGDFDVISITGGNSEIGTATLGLNFSGNATAPDPAVAFWQATHTWDILTVGGTGKTVGDTSFSTITNGTFAAGKFTTAADGNGGINLIYTPIPEPTGFALSAGISLHLLARHRRSRPTTATGR